MQQAIDYLANHHNSSLSDDEVRKNIEIVESCDYEEVMSQLNNYYRPTDLKPRSAGSFLWGNQQSFYGDVTQGCSAIAVGALGYKDRCGYSVWAYQKGKMIELSGNGSERAYIYVDVDWTRFTESERKQLVEKGIKEVSVLQTRNSSHQTLHHMKPLNEYEIVYPGTKKLKENSTSLFFIVLLVVVIVCIVYFK